MTDHVSSEKSVFLKALELPDQDERDDYLRKACAEDDRLLDRLRFLLDKHSQGRGPLDSPPVVEPTIDMPPVAEKPGTQIGPYKLREQIGEGGFGVVYVAEQEKPVARKVALKIIKPGMDTKDVIARFEAERQALALMDHPNIAKVLDAGTTGENPESESQNANPSKAESGKRKAGSNTPPLSAFRSPLSPAGRPYFVMELVRGVPITEFCDERKLSTRERLHLFIDVCRAVQHAHQKGIIHRDLKPSNVMVTLHDDKPVVKVIDFGVSKALASKLTEKTVYTAYGQMVGTPLYMSPEQAQLSGLDVDTRSDVYSLGVLLYELLTGTTPFDKETLQKSGFDEMRRIIREVDPPRPSARISTLRAEMLSTVSDKRKIDPRKLGVSYRGELDWIVMKALEKDRNRRYESASAFAADVQQYLADEPVQARPASAWYRFRKFARRKKATLALGSLIAFFVVTMGSGVGWVVRDRKAREDTAERERLVLEKKSQREREDRRKRVARQVESILDDVDRLMEQQKWPEALATAERAETAIESGNADDATSQQVRAVLKDLRFIDRLEQIRMQRATLVDGQFNLGGADREYVRAFQQYGVDVDRLPAEKSIHRLKARPALTVAVGAALDDWVYCRHNASKADDARWKRLVAVARGVDHNRLRNRLRAMRGKRLTPDLQAGLRRLADSIDVDRQPPATLVSLVSALRATKQPEVAARLLRRAQNAYRSDFWINYELGWQLYERGDFDGAIRFATAALALRPKSSGAHNNLGVALGELRRFDESVSSFRKALQLDPKHPNARLNLGTTLYEMRRYRDALVEFRKAIGLGSDGFAAYFNLGNALNQVKKSDEAIAAYRKAIELDPKQATAHSGLGDALRDQGKLDEAIVCHRKAIKLDEKYAPAYTGLGLALREQQKLDEAVAAYRKSIELDPKSAPAHTNLGNALHAQGKLAEAIACHRQAIELDRKYAPAYSNLGVALHYQQQYAKAVAAYRKAIQLSPNYVEAYYNLGIALGAQKKLNEAVAAFRKAIELNPKFARAYTCLCSVHYQMGRQLVFDGRASEGIPHLRAALRVNPQNPNYTSALAYQLVNCADPRLRKPAEGLKLASKLVGEFPQNSGGWQLLGWAKYRTGDWQGSIDVLRKSMRLQKGGTGDAGQWVVLAMAYHQLGRKELARKYYDDSVRWLKQGHVDEIGIARLVKEAAHMLGVKRRDPVAAARPKRRP